MIVQPEAQEIPDGSLVDQQVVITVYLDADGKRRVRVDQGGAPSTSTLSALTLAEHMIVRKTWSNDL